MNNLSAQCQITRPLSEFLPAESWSSRTKRTMLNCFPAYRRSSGRVVHLSADGRFSRVRIPLNWKTRANLGSMFGGSMYAAIDPIYLVMYTQLLGKDYVVWDKAANIEFIKPGKEALYADFNISEKELVQVKAEITSEGKTIRHYEVLLCNKDGEIHVRVQKTLYMRKKKAKR